MVFYDEDTDDLRLALLCQCVKRQVWSVSDVNLSSNCYCQICFGIVFNLTLE